MRTRLTFALASFALLTFCLTSSAQVRSGDILPYTLVGSGLDPAHSIEVPDASFLRIHFAEIVLEDGARLEIANGAGRVLQVFEGSDRTDAWSFVIYDQPALVTLREASSDFSRFSVESVVSGYPGFGLEAACVGAACGANIACQQSTLPTYMNRRPVARFHGVDNTGPFTCTAWMIGDPDCLITNNHCIANTPVGTMMAEFNYECDKCANGNPTVSSMFGITAVLASAANLDWALLDVNGAPGVGILKVSTAAPVVGKPVYVIHHSAGNRKGISFGKSTKIYPPGPVPCGTASAVSYTALVTGGASGSPAICKSSDRVEALIHCGNPANCDDCDGVPMSDIAPVVKPHLDNHGCTYDFQAVACGNSSYIATSKTSTIEINGAAAKQNDIALAFHHPSMPACDVYFDCNANKIICSTLVTCNVNDTAATVAKNLATAINTVGSDCNTAGFGALAINNYISVTGPAGTEFECCLASLPETLNCTGPNLSWLPLRAACDVNNVCNNTSCDENQVSAGDGLDFSKSHPHNYCSAGTSSSGCVAAISASGIASASAGSGFLINTTLVEGGKNGLYFYGQNGQQANAWGNSSSFQCVMPPVRRGGLLPAFGTLGACDGVFFQDLNARWCPTCPKPAHAPTPGLPIQVQLWYRDPGSTSNQTTSLSGAIASDVIP